MKPHIKNYVLKSLYLKIFRKLRTFDKLWKYFIALSSLVCLILFYLYLFNKKEESVKVVSKCEVSSEEKRNLFKLLNKVVFTLNKLEITNILCYASLWGAIQESGPLPWDPNAELCILSSNLVVHEETAIHRAFHQQYLSLEYKSSDGEYVVRNADSSELSPQIRLIIFEADSRMRGMLRRVGWKRRLLPPDCDAHPDLQCFPNHLINPPLPKKSFGPLSLNGPREDIDLLKFHYPDTWWKPLKPNC